MKYYYYYKDHPELGVFVQDGIEPYPVSASMGERSIFHARENADAFEEAFSERNARIICSISVSSKVRHMLDIQGDVLTNSLNNEDLSYEKRQPLSTKETKPQGAAIVHGAQLEGIDAQPRATRQG